MYAYERPSKEALEETSPKETEPLKPIQAFGVGTVPNTNGVRAGKSDVNDTTGLLSMDRILGIQPDPVQMQTDQAAPYVRPLDISRQMVVQRAVDVDLVKMGSSFTWAYLSKLMAEHGVDSTLKNIIRNVCIYLTEFAFKQLDLTKYLNILGTYVGYLELLKRAIDLIPKPIQNVILYGIGWAMRQFSVKCLKGQLSERRISQVIMATSGFSEGLGAVINLLRVIQKPGDLVYRGLSHLMGWDTSTTETTTVSESDSEEQQDNLINQKTKFFWVRMGSPHIDDWSGGEHGGLHMDGSFGVRLFGRTMGSEEVDLKIPYSGDWMLSFGKTTLLDKNIGLAGIFRGGPVIADVIHIDADGLNKIIIHVEDMSFGDDVVTSDKMQAIYTRDTKALDFSGDATFNILGHEVGANFDLGVDLDGNFTHGSLDLKNTDSFDLVPGKVTLKDPEFMTSFDSKGYSVGAVGSLELKLIDGLDIAAQTLSIMYSSDKGFVGSLDRLVVDIGITDKSFVRFELLDAVVSRAGFKAATVRLTYAYNDPLDKKSDGDDSEEESKPVMDKSAIKSLLPGFDMSWIGGSLETLVVQASSSGVSVTSGKGLQSDDTAKRLVKFGAKLFGIEASFDGDTGTGRIAGNYGPKEISVGSPDVHLPLFPGIYAGLRLKSSLGFKAGLAGTLERGKPLEGGKTAWHVGGLANAEATGGIEFIVHAGVGDPLIVALQGELFAKAEALLRGGGRLKGTVIYDENTNAVTRSKDDQVKANYYVEGKLSAALGGRIRARAFYIFSKKLYEVQFKEWDLGKFQVTGEYLGDGKVKTKPPTFDGKLLPDPPEVEQLEMSEIHFLQKMEKNSKIRIKDHRQMFRLLHVLDDPSMPTSVLSNKKRSQYMRMLGERNDSSLTNFEDVFTYTQARQNLDGVISYMMSPEEWVKYSTTAARFSGDTSRDSVKTIDLFVRKFHDATDNTAKIAYLDVLIGATKDYEKGRFISRKPMTTKLRFDAIKERDRLQTLTGMTYLT